MIQNLIYSPKVIGGVILVLILIASMNALVKHGYNQKAVEDARRVERKTDAANRADELSSRCSRDPACRLRDDGWRRD